MVQEEVSGLKKQMIDQIITSRSIRPLFQPIVSLRDGSVFGYEALSRISQEDLYMPSDDLFTLAGFMEKTWQLEQICRSEILKCVKQYEKIFKNHKLFLNISPQVLLSDYFESGFDAHYLSRYHINTSQIVFEITEKESVGDINLLNERINNYKDKGFEVAIDDLGSCYSGLSLVCEIAPKYMKLDRTLIRQVASNHSRTLLIKNLVDYANSMNIKIIAEGIETKEDLDALIKLGIHYGQGYFISMPMAEPSEIEDAIHKMIVVNNIKKNSMLNYRINQFYIKHLSIQGISVSKEVKVEQLLAYFNENSNVQGICVTEDDNVIGILTKERFQKLLSGRYGFSLYQYKNVSEIMEKNFLEVDYMMPVSSVSSIAMQRDESSLYDFIVVTKKGNYYGIVTIKELLMKATEISILTAREENPLTGLPGNIIINEKIANVTVSNKDATIMYIDMDNFKPYNDVYGFEKGDEIIKMLAGILIETADHNDFVGHIGGDDFIFITEKNAPEMIMKYILNKFDERIKYYYSNEDQCNGFMIAQGRSGRIERIPLVALTIAHIDGRERKFRNTYEITEELAKRKKQIKNTKYEYMVK